MKANYETETSDKGGQDSANRFACVTEITQEAVHNICQYPLQASNGRELLVTFILVTIERYLSFVWCYAMLFMPKYARAVRLTRSSERTRRGRVFVVCKYERKTRQNSHLREPSRSPLCFVDTRFKQQAMVPHQSETLSDASTLRAYEKHSVSIEALESDNPTV